MYFGSGDRKVTNYKGMNILRELCATDNQLVLVASVFFV